MNEFQRLRGLRALVGDAVEHGSAAVQRVHLATAARPFALLARIPAIAGPASVAHLAYDVWVSSIYGMVRIGNRAVGTTLDVLIEVAQQAPAPPERTLPPSE